MSRSLQKWTVCALAALLGACTLPGSNDYGGDVSKVSFEFVDPNAPDGADDAGSEAETDDVAALDLAPTLPGTTVVVPPDQLPEPLGAEVWVVYWRPWQRIEGRTKVLALRRAVEAGAPEVEALEAELVALLDEHADLVFPGPSTLAELATAEHAVVVHAGGGWRAENFDFGRGRRVRMRLPR